MKNRVEQPVHRGRLRMALGTRYFTFIRYFLWMFGRLHFAKPGNRIDGYVYFAHKTPLYRKLKDVDMYLQHNKVINLTIALPRLNGLLLQPGETFSYWKLIGKPTKRKGYVDGMVLHNGSFSAATGGGLCQLSNLIYWMSIHTPLTILERHRHGYDVFPDSNRTQPFGSGATCFYNYGDLMIRNDTQDTFQLLLDMDDQYLKGCWQCASPPEYHYEVYEKEHLFQPEYWGGYTRHNVLYRKKYLLDGTLLGDEYVTENHAIAMYSPLLPDDTKSSIL